MLVCVNHSLQPIRNGYADRVGLVFLDKVDAGTDGDYFEVLVAVSQPLLQERPRRVWQRQHRAL